MRSVVNMPESNAGPDQVLAFQYSTTMSAELDEGETGALVGLKKGKVILRI